MNGYHVVEGNIRSVHAEVPEGVNERGSRRGEKGEKFQHGSSIWTIWGDELRDFASRGTSFT